MYHYMYTKVTNYVLTNHTNAVLLLWFLCLYCDLNIFLLCGFICVQKTSHNGSPPQHVVVFIHTDTLLIDVTYINKLVYIFAYI